MAAKRQKEWVPLLRLDQAAGLVLIVGILSLVVSNLTAIMWAVLVAASGIVAFLVWRHFEQKAAIGSLHDQLEALINQHESALISYYHQNRSADLFGNRDESRWHERIDTFLRTQLVPDVADYAAWRKSKIGQQAAGAVDRITAQKVDKFRQSNPLAKIKVDDLTPIEYERYCADLLRERGWRIQMTPATCDGGADFIAEKGSARIVFQCKRYSKPVGNKAVQEVTSAVRLYKGNFAAVVAPNGYTRQAQREAEGLRVHLLHHSALPAFADGLAPEAASELSAELSDPLKSGSSALVTWMPSRA